MQRRCKSTYPPSNLSETLDGTKTPAQCSFILIIWSHSGAFFFMGGLLLILGGILEFFLGNSFSSVVFSTYGGFWLAFAATLTPSFAAFASYAPSDATSTAEGLTTRGFNATFGETRGFACAKEKKKVN